MFINSLDVVNSCLGTIGEVPLNSLDTDHPYVSASVKLLREANARVQSRGWWFNRETITLHPDEVSREITVPPDILSLDTQSGQLKYAVRGRRLYDLGKGTYQFTEGPVTVVIVRLLPFEDLPFIAQDVVQAATVVRFVESYDADRSRVEQVRADYALAEANCNAEHVRNSNANFLTQGAGGAARLRVRYPGGRSGHMRTH